MMSKILQRQGVPVTGSNGWGMTYDRKGDRVVFVIHFLRSNMLLFRRIGGVWAFAVAAKREEHKIDIDCPRKGSNGSAILQNEELNLKEPPNGIHVLGKDR